MIATGWPNTDMKKRVKELPTNSFDLTVGRNLERIKGDMTIEQLADVMDTSVSYAWNMLKGKRRWNTSYLKIICDHFKCSVAQLFEGATPYDRPTEEHDSTILSAYYALEPEDKRIVDRFLFLGEKNTSLTINLPTNKPSTHKEKTK